MRSLNTALLALAFALSSSCVTVNVNLPEGAVQRAADDYVRELYRAKDRKGGTGTEASPKPSSAFQPLLIAEAWAEGVFSVRSPKALSIQKKQREIADDVNAQKAAGVFGEANDGLLVLRDVAKLSGPKKVRAEKLLAQENALRKDLYDEALASATAAVELSTIQRSFAHSFQEFSPKGTWVQSDAGQWSRKTTD